MSYENVTDFQDFMGAGREGLYSSNKENKGWIVVSWLSVPTDMTIGSPPSKGCDLCLQALILFTTHVVLKPLDQVQYSSSCLVLWLTKNTGIVPPSTYNQQGHICSRTNWMDPYPTESTIRDCARKVQHCLE